MDHYSDDSDDVQPSSEYPQYNIVEPVQLSAPVTGRDLASVDGSGKNWLVVHGVGCNPKVHFRTSLDVIPTINEAESSLLNNGNRIEDVRDSSRLFLNDDEHFVDEKSYAAIGIALSLREISCETFYMLLLFSNLWFHR